MRATGDVNLLLLTTLLLAACSGSDTDGEDGDGSTAPLAPVIHTVGGTVFGLAGTGLMLQNNGNNRLEIRENGDFTFTTSLRNGTRYNVSVLAQPARPAQTCTVTDGSGTVSGDDVTNVEVNCTTDTYTVGGTVTGLAAGGLVLQNNAGDDLAISAPGTFTFPAALTSGATYDVTVLTQPSVGPSQNCVVARGNGTVINTAVTNVAITCTYSVTNLYFTVAAGTVLFAAHSGPGAVSVIAVDALQGALALVMPVTY